MTREIGEGRGKKEEGKAKRQDMRIKRQEISRQEAA